MTDKIKLKPCPFRGSTDPFKFTCSTCGSDEKKIRLLLLELQDEGAAGTKRRVGGRSMEQEGEMTTKASTRYKVSKKVVKRYLADHDLTQKQLAQMAGITPGALSALIRCQRDMRVGNLFALADAMRMDPRDLVEKVNE